MNSTLGSVVPLAMFKVQKLSLSNILYLSLSSSLFVFVFFVYRQETRLYSTSASTELEGYEVTKVTRVTGVTMAVDFFFFKL